MRTSFYSLVTMTTVAVLASHLAPSTLHADVLNGSGTSFVPKGEISSAVVDYESSGRLLNPDTSAPHSYTAGIPYQTTSTGTSTPTFYVYFVDNNPTTATNFHLKCQSYSANSWRTSGGWSSWQYGSETQTGSLQRIWWQPTLWAEGTLNIQCQLPQRDGATYPSFIQHWNMFYTP